MQLLHHSNVRLIQYKDLYSLKVKIANFLFLITQVHQLPFKVISSFICLLLNQIILCWNYRKGLSSNTFLCIIIILLHIRNVLLMQRATFMWDALYRNIWNVNSKYISEKEFGILKSGNSIIACKSYIFNCVTLIYFF